MDKDLKYHDLLQAYSRTNRVEKETKPFGIIICYRNLKKRTDDALTLFSKSQDTSGIVVPGYQYFVEKFNEMVMKLKEIALFPESVDTMQNEDDQKKFVVTFRELTKYLQSLQTFIEFSFDQDALIMSEQEYQDYKSKYLMLYSRQKTDREVVSVLNDVDFCIELMESDRINVAYIMNLIRNIHFDDPKQKYKRGVVKAILSKRIRFADDRGNYYPEWSECTLQEVVDFLDGQRKPLESADRAKRQGKYPYYGASGIIDYIDDYIFDEPLLLLGEDGANIINRSSPLCFIATGKYWVNNHAHVMRPRKGQNIKFICELLESLDYTRYNTGTAQPKLNQEKCRQIALHLPTYEEQCHIAEFLSLVEQKSIHAQTELDSLLRTKNALMQQLFI